MPSISHQRESRIFQQGKGHNGNSSRRSRITRELCVGCILFLPERLEGNESVRCILDTCCCNKSELDKEGYNHYVVILDVFQSDDGEIRCYIAKLTSKKGTTRYPIDRIKISQTFLASPPNEDTGLFLENGGMPRQSYISLSHVFQISPFVLRSNKPAYNTRLTEQSYKYLMLRLGLEAAVYEDTNIVKQSGATIRSASKPTLYEDLIYFTELGLWIGSGILEFGRRGLRFLGFG
ncbi:uncharacterized protein EAF01_003705 [Botrytis porri]|uniref:uncharacterized protein n=1 Tax=Botrytis porri TaxID=87229 RepID=UPI0018FF56EE|nr:uncharacterized protein EAF01_003705 [Botrytis porri]KAF7909987.1 hypothetical protein EAF01_003705 [Botrytis porri]